MGDIDGNAALASRVWQQGRDASADMVALPEMFITGYNAQDLVVKPAFHHAAMAAVTQLAADCADGPALGIGGPWAEDGKLYNAYFILRGGEITSRVLKNHLPNETVFDEVRIFDAGPLAGHIVWAIPVLAARSARILGMRMYLRRCLKPGQSFY